MESGDGDSTTTTPQQWNSTMVVVAGVVGMLAVLVWWLCCRCSRVLELKRVVAAKKAVLFQFLSDPQSLMIIHPYTTEIRVEKKTEEEGGSTLKKFEWVEKVPFTVMSVARMRCDPTTSTITMDIVPPGGMFEVQLKWCLKSGHTESSELQTDDQLIHGNSSHPELPTGNETTTAVIDSTGKQTTGDDPTDDKTTNPNDFVDDSYRTTILRVSAEERSTKTDSKSTDAMEASYTEFYNRVQVTGPRLVTLLVMAMTLRSIQTTMMDKVQQHFQTLNQ